MSKNHILHHFAPQHAIEGIRARGLIKGAMPWNLDKHGNPTMTTHHSGNPKIKGPGYQWLTVNGSWDQSWAFLGNLPYPKNAYRITVLIPEKAALRFLHHWKALCDRGRPDCAPFINTKGVDWTNWFVFYGPIPPTWFLEVQRNMGQQIIADQHGGG
jgi:hypothetical protein